MLNLDQIGVPFAKIIGGKYNNEVVSVSEDSFVVVKPDACGRSPYYLIQFV